MILALIRTNMQHRAFIFDIVIICLTYHWNRSSIDMFINYNGIELDGVSLEDFKIEVENMNYFAFSRDENREMYMYGVIQVDLLYYIYGMV